MRQRDTAGSRASPSWVCKFRRVSPARCAPTAPRSPGRSTTREPVADVDIPARRRDGAAGVDAPVRLLAWQIRGKRTAERESPLSHAENEKDGNDLLH